MSRGVALHGVPVKPLEWKHSRALAQQSAWTRYRYVDLIQWPQLVVFQMPAKVPQDDRLDSEHRRRFLEGPEGRAVPEAYDSSGRTVTPGRAVSLLLPMRWMTGALSDIGQAGCPGCAIKLCVHRGAAAVACCS
jgi:hypothetical protein